MKKLIAIVVAVVLVIAAFGVAMPTSAEPDVVFETSLVPQLQNVGTGPYTSVSLDEGEVKVYADGGYKVEIKGLTLDDQLVTGDLGVILWDIEYDDEWQRAAGYAATPATISLEDGEGKLEVPGGSAGSIYSGDHSGFVAQVTDPGVAWLLMSGFNIPE